MRLTIAIQISLAASLLTVPSLVVAQQRGTAVPAAMAAPTRQMTMPAISSMVHVTSHLVAPAVGVHVTGHGSVSGTHPVPPRTPVHPVGPKPPVHNQPAHGNPVSTNGPVGVLRPGSGINCGVPGLGFDYVHYAAVHPNGQPGCFQSGSVFPFVGGGIYIPATGYVDSGGATEPAGDAQQNEGPETSAEVVEPAPEEQIPTAQRVRSHSNPAPKATPEYIFVRRDGTVFFAVAYSWVNGNLQYITQDGLRKLVSATTLDMDATTQFNEQRGVAFHSPA